MSTRDTNTLGVLRLLCLRHHFVNSKTQDYLLEMALELTKLSFIDPIERDLHTLPPGKHYSTNPHTADKHD